MLKLSQPMSLTPLDVHIEWVELEKDQYGKSFQMYKPLSEADVQKAVFAVKGGTNNRRLHSAKNKQ